jgi:hypothetical protein
VDSSPGYHREQFEVHFEQEPPPADQEGNGSKS